MKQYEPTEVQKQANIDIETPRPVRKKKNDGKYWEQMLYTINCLAIIAVMTVFTVIMLFGKRPTISEAENRDLAKCPKFTLSSYFDGSFTSGFSSFFNDTVPGRKGFKAFIANYRSHFGFGYGDGVVLYGNVPTGDKGGKPSATPTETVTETTAVLQLETAQAASETLPPTEAPTEPPTVDPMEKEAEGEFANNILIVNHRGIMLYGGGYETGRDYALTLNAYKEMLGSGVNVYSMTAPTAVSYYLPKNYADMTASEKDNIDNIHENLVDVEPVDVYSALLEHKGEDIYSRTDHHWKPLGAFYAAEEFAKTAGVPFADISKYETESRDDYVGTLYGFTDSADLLNNPETFTVYRPKNQYTTTYYNQDFTEPWEGPLVYSMEERSSSSLYLSFMGGDSYVTKVETDCTNGRKLMIVKDSYGNALVPCLTSSFSEIYVVDMRYFECGIVSFAQEQGITDLLFAMNTYSATGGNEENLHNYLY